MNNLNDFNSDDLYGLNIYLNRHITIGVKFVQFRFPKSKKKRIRKKWSKDHKNFKRVEFDQCFKLGNDLFVSEKIYNQLRSVCPKNFNLK